MRAASTGKHLSEVSRKRISEALTGRKQSEETIRKRSAAITGRHLSEVSRKRISEALTGHRQSEETKHKKSAALKGKPLSEAHRMHLSEGRKGMVFTEEHRRHLSEAKKGAKPWNRKSVLMYDQSGNFVMEFESVKAAADYIGDCSQNICKQLTGKRKFVRGYTFRYKENPDR